MADEVSIEGNVTRLSFSLTRLQRIVNPPGRMLFAFLGLLWTCFSVWKILTPPWWSFIPVLCIFWFVWFVIGKTVRWFLRDLFGRHYFNTIGFEGGCIRFGIDGFQWFFIGCSSLKVAKGLFGTIIVYDAIRGFAWVLPKRIITCEQLKAVIASQVAYKGEKDLPQSLAKNASQDNGKQSQ